MKIATIIPAIQNKGPVVVAKDIIESLASNAVEFHLYYFDKKPEGQSKFDIGKCTQFRLSLFKTFDFDQYDVVHCHSLRPDIYTSFWRNKIKPPVITTIHNYVDQEMSFQYGRLGAKGISRIWANAWKTKNHLVYLTQHMQEYYQSHLGVRIPSTVIHNGRKILDCPPLRPSEFSAVSQLKAKYFLLGACASVTKRKRLDTLVRFTAKNHQIASVIVGEGPELDNLKSLAVDLGVENRVFFPGFQHNVASWMSLFDAYMMSSHSEGFPLVTLESALLGRPILCVDLPLFRELYNEEQVAFFDPDNMESIHVAYQRLRSDYAKYSANLLIKVKTDYSIENMASSYYNLYSTLSSR